MSRLTATFHTVFMTMLTAVCDNRDYPEYFIPRLNFNAMKQTVVDGDFIQNFFPRDTKLSTDRLSRLRQQTFNIG